MDYWTYIHQFICKHGDMVHAGLKSSRYDGDLILNF